MLSKFWVETNLEELSSRVKQLEDLNDELRPGGDKMEEYNSGYRAGLCTARHIIGTCYDKILHKGMDYEMEEKDDNG